MSDEARAPARGYRPWTTWGEAATASFLAAVLSGVALAIPYDVTDPLTSVATMLLANPAAVFFRNLHYWSAQAFLLLLALHLWDHLRRPHSRPVRAGPWARVCLSAVATGLLAWSGFVLKGDVESFQALRVVSTTVASVPAVGPPAAAALFGRGEGLQLVYLHHAATLTLFVWFVLVEHGRVLWPRPAAAATVVVPLALLSCWISPALHDGLSMVIKGPWYFVGLQEAFHWSPWPMLVVAALLVPLALLFAAAWMPPRGRRATLWALYAMAGVYAGLTIVGWAFRGSNWTWTNAWRTLPRSFVVSPVHAIPDPDGEPLRGRRLPVVMGRPEGCLVCHAGVTGLSESHDPSAIGCASCHLGNVFSLDARAAHAGMLVVPGNLADAARTCGGGCHPSIVSRLERSLMTTNAGLVIVNRRAWAEPVRDGVPHITDAGSSPADSHLRHLCASCHLGVPKVEPAPVTEASRGGGCTACHARYGPEAASALARYLGERARGPGAVPPAVHPDVALPVDNAPCFGCHSRSGRISLSYDGWHEADPLPPQGSAVRRTLEDGRVVVRSVADGHSAKGMLCVDCHTPREVMGDGVPHARQLDQPHVACEDCHPVGRPRTVALAAADEEARRVARLRKLPIGSHPVLTTAGGDVLVNAFQNDEGRLVMLRKKDGVRLELKAPPAQCRDTVHGRVSCIGCHTAWAPRCPTCHTRFDPAAEGYDHLAARDVRGDWVESGGGLSAAPPTLGLRRVSSAGAGSEAFEPFIPGMVVSLDSSALPGGSARPIFRRWYARAFSHTVTKQGRSCASCHNDPVALGYGEGRLEFVGSGGREGRWRFTAAHGAGADGLPEAAWIGFLQTRTDDVSTRDDVRPLSVGEQQRVLAVGACLTCHAEDSPVMRDSLRGFEQVVARMTAQCVRAAW